MPKSNPSRLELIGRDLFLKRTDKDGRVTHTAHRVWDAERFFSSELAAAKKESGKVEQLSEEQFISATRKEKVQA